MPSRPIRVLHAIHDFLPQVQAGSEIYAFELCRTLQSRGHHVTVVCASFDPLREHGHVRWRTYEGLPVIDIANNWRVHSFEDTYHDPLIEQRLESALVATQPEVVHAHSLLNLSLQFPAIARRRGARVVATLHDYTLVCPSGGQRLHRNESHLCAVIDPTRCARCFPQSPFGARLTWGRATRHRALARPLTVLSRTVRTLAPHLATRAAGLAPQVPLGAADISLRLAAVHKVFNDIDAFVAPSSSMAREYVALGIPPGKLTVSDYGFPGASAPPTDAHDRQGQRQAARGAGETPSHPLRIGFVGTPVWHKGLHVLLEAARRLPRDGYTLTVAGDLAIFPDYAATLRAQAANLPVAFLGAITRDRIHHVYADLDVLVVPSIWLENSPLVIHEAMLAGVPVVGSNLGGIPDLVEHERNGLLFDAGDAAALAHALSRLIADRALLGRLADHPNHVKSIDEDAREWEERYLKALRADTARQSTPGAETSGQTTAAESACTDDSLAPERGRAPVSAEA